MGIASTGRSPDTDRVIWNEGFKQGIEEGKKRTRKEVLSLLEAKFMNMKLPTNDPVMVATLAIAKELSESDALR